MSRISRYFSRLRHHWRHPSPGRMSGLDILRYIGPGLLVTVGFIDPGNWASNLAAGADFGYALLWVVTLSTIMLIVLQHNVAHLGIVTGLCLSEAATRYLPRRLSRPLLWSAMGASVSTSLAEILGSAIALNLLFGLPLTLGAALTAVAVVVLLFSNTYRRVERAIIMFVSIIGLSFIYELTLVPLDAGHVVRGLFTLQLPEGSMLVVMSVLGAVVMPHNLFLHSEVIQSRQLPAQGSHRVERALKYEFYDTLLAMTVGWVINSAMIVLAATTFHAHGVRVEALEEAGHMLSPLLGGAATTIFALALLMAGLASTVTSGMAAGSIFAGLYEEPYDASDAHSRVGVLISIGLAFLVVLVVGDPFRGLLISQAVLSLQLPFTVFLQVGLTSSRRVMGPYANSRFTTVLLYAIAVAVSLLNVFLLVELAL